MTTTPSHTPDPQCVAWVQGAITGDGILAFVAALLAAVVVIGGYAFQKSQARKAEQALVYGEAIRAVHDYLEAPYKVLRRDGSAGARMAITNHVSDVQSRLAYYSTVLRVHAPEDVRDAYRELVSAARSEAGPQMTAAWRHQPTRRDRDVPLLTRLEQPQSDLALENTIRTMAAKAPPGK